MNKTLPTHLLRPLLVSATLVSATLVSATLNEQIRKLTGGTVVWTKD